MPIAARRVIRFASGFIFAGAAVACGTEGGEGLYGGELRHDFGFVGSGAGGSGYARDGGNGGSDAGRPTTLDGGRSADGSSAPRADGGMSDQDGNVGEGDDASADATNPSDGGSSVNVTFNLPPGLFTSLDWVISGPAGYYSGTVYFGQAHSIEFVAGGIQAGTAYTLTLAGNDRYGDACSGTSAPFDVVAGEVSGAGVVLNCDIPVGDAAQPANIMTGAVGVEAGVVLRDM